MEETRNSMQTFNRKKCSHFSPTNIPSAFPSEIGRTIDHVDDSTLNLLFEVTTDAGDEILIPASNDLIEEVSAEKKEIRMAIPEGLLDL